MINHTVGNEVAEESAHPIRPHFKLMVVDVTHSYDTDFVKANGIERIEEVYLYDDSRRYFLCSATPHVEGWGVTRRVVLDCANGEDRSDDYEEIETDLAPADMVDYFSDWKGNPTFAFDPITDEEYADLCSGERSYDDIRDSYIDAARCNEMI